MPFSKKRVKGQKRKLQFPCFLRLYVVNTIVWLFCESETCAFSVLFGYFATLPKDAALVQSRCWYAFITGTSVHFIGVIHLDYRFIIFISSECLFIQHTKKKRRKNESPLLWFGVSSKRFFQHPWSLKACGLEWSSHFKSGAIKCSHAFCHWPYVCPNTITASHSHGDISSHLTGSGLLIGLILAMPYTCSLTLNRASLLTMLMFSTGVSVCSCTVLYTVENTWFSPFLSEDMNPRRYMCVSWSCIKDSVRKHTVALTKKKQCCTDQYIWWSLCVSSIHL